MSNAENVVERCPAKINLTLSVGPPRPDNGYHPISSWMVAVTLFEELTLRQTDGASRFDIAWAEDAAQRGAIDWPVEKDLTYKAHRLVREYTGRDLPVHATLRKRIAVGAGMGGGSSDAAGMLRALNRLFELGLSRETLGQLAARLGSDVAFFLGEPSAIVSGLGETVEPAPLDTPMFFALILPDLRCDTAAVYRMFDVVRPDAALRIIRPDRKAEGVLTNDLAGPAFTVEPRLRELRDLCVRATGKSVHVTGSGAAMFTVHPDASAAALTARRIRERCGVPALAVKTLAGRDGRDFL